MLTHLGLEVDTKRGMFRVHADRAARLRKRARALLCDASRQKRALPVRRLAEFTGLAQSVYLAVPASRFFLRALHDMVGTRDSWAGKVKLTRQAQRDLEWWGAFSDDHNGRPIWTLADRATGLRGGRRAGRARR